MEKRNQKILFLWLMIICGFACHTLTDILPMFWGKDMAMAATDGNVDQGMIVFMMTLSFLVPVCGMFCVLTDCRAKSLRVVNAVLAVVIGLFNVAHAFMELPSVSWHSIKFIK